MQEASQVARPRRIKSSYRLDNPTGRKEDPSKNTQQEKGIEINGQFGRRTRGFVTSELSITNGPTRSRSLWNDRIAVKGRAR